MIYTACPWLSPCQLLPLMAAPNHVARGGPAAGAGIRSQRVIGMDAWSALRREQLAVGWAVSLVNAKCPVPFPHIPSLFSEALSPPSRRCPPCAEVASLSVSLTRVSGTQHCVLFISGSRAWCSCLAYGGHRDSET